MLASIFSPKNTPSFESFDPKSLILSTDKLKLICSELVSKFEKELEFSPNSMLPTFIDRFPLGNEEGTFMAIDIGGTNIRLDLIALKKHKAPAFIANCTKPIPGSYKKGSGTKLFEFIALEIIGFLEGKKIEKSPVPLGFTFSFPLKQTSINSGHIFQWNKDFHCEDALMKDPVLLLQCALEKQGYPDLVKVSAIVNDTIATLLSGIYINSNAKIGLILGTGTNASYVEKTQKIASKIEGSFKSEYTLVNTEFGSTDINSMDFISFLSTKYDQLVDKNSANPGNQILEKMISGRYLGEIFSYILVENGYLKEGDPFYTAIDMNAIESKYDTKAKGSHKDSMFMWEVCSAISSRSAQLAACVICALIILSNNQCEDMTVVAIDGSIFENYHKYAERLEQAISSIIGSSKVKLIFCKDGSGIGAAIAASLYAS